MVQAAFSNGKPGHSQPLVPDQTYSFQRTRDLAVVHKPMPDISRPGILSTQQYDSDIDANNITVNPARAWIEGIYKPVPAINLVTILPPHRA